MRKDASSNQWRDPNWFDFALSDRVANMLPFHENRAAGTSSTRTTWTPWSPTFISVGVCKQRAVPTCLSVQRDSLACYAVAMLLLCCFYAVAMLLLWCVGVEEVGLVRNKKGGCCVAIDGKQLDFRLDRLSKMPANHSEPRDRER